MGYKIITVANIKTYILQIYKKYNITKDCVTQEDKSPLKFSKETLNYEDFIKIRYLILIL